ncbi:hypothetical protein [Petropleomorpha daqingensis]|uniref:Uncharacterized protein n=1 Tax=Petropleomorpha daqingensis TaxID=2026353 RepID=A0A853CJX3_9ACTN|nr:hypothetical protein [Petropleomorpha daqingensis]NYJ06568.1 hypothetical protein [Petropleomorpha daqingensis]
MTALRCRLGLHRWQNHRVADGLVVTTCPLCGRQEGPVPAAEDPGPRIDPRDIPPGGS